MPDEGVISATEANRQFSRLLRAVENGGRVTITKDGKPVAVLTPVAEPAENAAARRRMVDLLRKGLSLNFHGGVDRDDAHRR